MFEFIGILVTIIILGGLSAINIQVMIDSKIKHGQWSIVFLPILLILEDIVLLHATQRMAIIELLGVPMVLLAFAMDLLVIVFAGTIFYYRCRGA